MIAIPNMEKPKKGEVIVFDGEYAVYTDDDMQVHRYPLIEIPTPHGRLIDWDAFNSKLEIQYAEGRGKTLAPTILEEEP